MTETPFIIGWFSPYSAILRSEIAHMPWSRVKYSIEKMPDPAREWLEAEQVDHSYGFVIINGARLVRRLLKVLTIHNPNQAMEFRLRFDAPPVNVEGFNDLEFTDFQVKLRKHTWF
jgi:hypothetical protein